MAKLRAVGIKNVTATLGAYLCPDQLPRIDLLSEMLEWSDSWSGMNETKTALLLSGKGVRTQSSFFTSPRRDGVPIPDAITDPYEFSLEQFK